MHRATKIGGPSHGFDIEGQCLLPLVANARSSDPCLRNSRTLAPTHSRHPLTLHLSKLPTPHNSPLTFSPPPPCSRHKVILVSDPAYPHHPVGRAHFRLLAFANSGKPVLWLETTNTDFRARVNSRPYPEVSPSCTPMI